MGQKIAVIGAGVIGLSSAMALQQKNKDYDIAVFAKDTINGLASRAAPAVWIPYKAGSTEEIELFARRSLATYQLLPPESGVKVMDMVEYTKEPEVPIWVKLLGQHVDLPASALPPTYTHGYSGKIHRIDSSVFVDYLTARFKDLGGVIIKKELTALTDINSEFKIIINCSGLGAAMLVPDANVYPILGQYVLTEKPKGLDKITLAHIDEDNYTLVAPRVHDCWLGGNAVMNNWDMTPDPALTKTILENAIALEPSLQGCKVLHEGIGLRPGRDNIRLDADQLADGRLVVHNYGHSGAGYVAAFGCAEEVVKLVSAI
jgi:D-amino-acid oxidase